MANVNNLMPAMTAAHIDEQMSSQKSVTSESNINVERNSLSFTLRLPTEILEAIFIHRARDYQSELSRVSVYSRIHNPPSWVNVSYVCRHWRNVALNCATLWTCLFIVSPRWTEELLARSRQAPLRLRVQMEYHYQDNFPCLLFVDQVMNHVGRIQELHLSLPFVVRDNQVFSKLSSPAPRLQKLVIFAGDVPPELEWSSALFDGDTPALHTLELINCSVSWYSFKLSNLTILILRHVPARFHQNTEEFLATLRCMRDVKHLDLVYALASATGFLSSAAFNTFQKIDLPHLSRFWIAAPLSTVVALLSCTNIPLQTEVRLECHFKRGPSLDDYTPLSPLLAQRFNITYDQASSGPTIRSLVIMWGEGTLTFTASERDRDFSISMPRTEWGCNIPLQTFVNFGHSVSTSDTWRNMDRLIRDLVYRSIPLTNVESVHVINPPFPSAFWRKIFEHIHNLRYLKLSGGYMPDLASVLAVTPHSYTKNEGSFTDRGADRLPAPALEELELYNISFSASLAEGIAMDPPAADTQSLFDALHTREESRGRLAVVECFATMSDHDVELDMVGRWEDGHFHVVEEYSRPCHSESNESEGSDYYSGL